jgi:hypothetical protein
VQYQYLSGDVAHSRGFLTDASFEHGRQLRLCRESRNCDDSGELAWRLRGRNQPRTGLSRLPSTSPQTGATPVLIGATNRCTSSIILPRARAARSGVTIGQVAFWLLAATPCLPLRWQRIVGMDLDLGVLT